MKFSVPEGSDFNAEYFFSKPAVLFVPNKIQIQLLNTDTLRFTQTINEKARKVLGWEPLDVLENYMI